MNWFICLMLLANLFTNKAAGFEINAQAEIVKIKSSGSPWGPTQCYEAIGPGKEDTCEVIVIERPLDPSEILNKSLGKSKDVKVKTLTRGQHQGFASVRMQASQFSKPLSTLVVKAKFRTYVVNVRGFERDQQLKVLDSFKVLD